MPASPATRCSPGREPRADKHKRGRSLESGILFKERDDDLALFNEVQSRETDNFLLQPNDDFEDTFVTKLRHFSDHKLGVNIPARGESSDLLNVEEEKNDYEWLITPPETPLFPSLDDEAPQVIIAQRGRTRTQPISISRSSTMEKNHRSSRGSASPNRLSPSPRSGNTVFQARGRASSAPSSSPPATLRPTTASRRLSPPSSKPSTPAPRTSTPNPRRLSTGSTGTPVKTSRGNSASPKVKAWQANIPGFSTEAPPNLRTSLADRPASYVRGSSPASRNGGHSKSPTASRSIGSSHSHDRDRFSSYSKGSIASSGDDDVESLPSIVIGGSELSNSRKVGGFRNNKAPVSQKQSRTVSSSSAPKRSFDLALRQMDHKKGPQNMFRPLLSSVPSSTFYAGKASPAWNSSVTTSSNASSDLGAHDIDGSELNHDDAASGCVKVLDSDVDDEVFMFEKTDSLNESHHISPIVGLGDFISRLDGLENLANREVTDDFDGTPDFPEIDNFNSRLENIADREVTNDSKDTADFPEIDTRICSRCGSSYSIIEPTEEDVTLCANCRKSCSPSTISDPVTTIVVAQSSQKEVSRLNEYQESFKTTEPQMTIVESPEVTRESETRSMQREDLVQDVEISPSQPESDENDPSQLSHQVTSQPSVNEQIQHDINVPNQKVESLEGEGISILLKRTSSIKGPVIRTGNFSASSISYDDFSYIRDSTNSVRSSVGRGSVSVSSSIDLGPATSTETRYQRQSSSKKSDVDNIYKHRRSASSLSGTSSRAFHPSSLGTSTLDTLDVSIARVGKDVADTTSVAPQETPEENDTSTENENENEDDNNVKVAIASTEELSTESQTVVDLGKVPLPESSNFEDSGKDTGALTTCTIEEGTSLNPCVDSTDVVEVVLGTITRSSSCASECDVLESSESSIEELRDPSVPTTLGKDIDASNHSSGIIEESTVLVESRQGPKGRSLTLEEATDTILFCSSIVHNLAYEAATIAIEKETPPDPSEHNDSWPLVPTVENKNEPQSRKTSKLASKSKKARQKKTVEIDTTKAPNGTNTDEETDVPTKPRIVFPNNKENTRPPKLESKCNCTIM